MGAPGAACAGVDAALRVRTTRPEWQVQPEWPSSTSLGSGILIHCWNLLSRQSRIDSVSSLTALGNLVQGHEWLLNPPGVSIWVDVLCEVGRFLLVEFTGDLPCPLSAASPAEETHGNFKLWPDEGMRSLCAVLFVCFAERVLENNW